MTIQRHVTLAALCLLASAGCTTGSGSAPVVQDPLAAKAAPGAASPALLPKDGSAQIEALMVQAPATDAEMDAQDPDDMGFEEADLAETKETSEGGVEPGDEITQATTKGIPLEMNEDVQRWIEYFTVRDADRFRRFLERGERFKPVITAVLKDQGIPTEIYYQAMIESGFSTHATSHASAVGIWQFIPGTGKRYGLRIDEYVDERRDPMRATIAAALYLKDLHNVFQSWYLAMAAYNAGEGRILGAIMRAKTRDFWEMVRMRALPAETMAYIPKFLAATTIGHNPAKYGFDDISAEMMPTLASIAVPSPVRLADVAHTTGIPHEVLKDANPHLMRGVTPPGVSTYRLWVPKDNVELVENRLERLAELRLRDLPAPRKAQRALAAAGRGGKGATASAAEPEKPRFHVVRTGDTLAKIAGTYGLSITALRKLNNLKTAHIVRGQRLLLWRPDAVKAESKTATAAVQRYRVKRGDNLEAIARRFNVSVNDLKKLNRMKRSTVYVGQVLKVADDRSI